MDNTKVRPEEEEVVTNPETGVEETAEERRQREEQERQAEEGSQAEQSR